MNSDKSLRREKSFKSFTESIEFLFHALLYLIFLMMFLGVVYSEINNFSKDTFGLTNYGFAILLGLATVCFSWARNLPKSKVAIADRLNEQAVDALYGGIIFLLASLFKYFSMAPDNEYLTGLYKSWPFAINIPRGFSFICFNIAAVKFFDVVFDVLIIISIIKKENWQKSIDKRDKQRASIQDAGGQKIDIGQNV